MYVRKVRSIYRMYQGDHRFDFPIGFFVTHTPYQPSQEATMTMQPFNTTFAGGNGQPSFAQMLMQNIISANDPERAAAARGIKEHFRNDRIKQVTAHKNECDECKKAAKCDILDILKTWMREA